MDLKRLFERGLSAQQARLESVASEQPAICQKRGGSMLALAAKRLRPDPAGWSISICTRGGKPFVQGVPARFAGPVHVG